MSTSYCVANVKQSPKWHKKIPSSTTKMNLYILSVWRDVTQWTSHSYISAYLFMWFSVQIRIWINLLYVRRFICMLLNIWQILFPTHTKNFTVFMSARSLHSTVARHENENCYVRHCQGPIENSIESKHVTTLIRPHKFTLLYYVNGG